MGLTRVADRGSRRLRIRSQQALVVGRRERLSDSKLSGESEHHVRFGTTLTTDDSRN